MYKSILFYFSIALLLCLTSCTSRNIIVSPKQINTEFISEAIVSLDDKTVECKISRIHGKAAYVTIFKPEDLKGMTFSWEDKVFNISYQNLSCNMDQVFIPEPSFVSLIFNILETASCEESLELLSSEHGMLLYSGVCPVGKFKMLVNDKTGFIEQLNLDNPNLNVNFFNQQEY